MYAYVHAIKHNESNINVMVDVIFMDDQVLPRIETQVTLVVPVNNNLTLQELITLCVNNAYASLQRLTKETPESLIESLIQNVPPE